MRLAAGLCSPSGQLRRKEERMAEHGGIRETIIHQSANRPVQLMGGDRELVLASALIAITVAFCLATWWGVFLGIAFWIAAAAVLRRMGKADPLLRHVYLRHVRYRPFYPAKAGLHSVPVEVPGSWR